jgi:sortase A
LAATLTTTLRPTESSAAKVPTPAEHKSAAARLAKPKHFPMPVWRVTAAFGCGVISVLALWCVLYVTVFSSLTHARAQHLLYARFRNEIAQAEGPVGGAIPAGSPVGVLDIPRAGIHGEVIVEGTSSTTLRSGPGHERTTPLPGQPGTSVVFGKALTFGGPFGSLTDLRGGDTITVTTDQGTMRFSVIDVRHPGDLQPLPPATGRITLVSLSGGLSPSKVTYVDADLQGQAYAAPSGRPTSLNANEIPMAGDSGSLVIVTLVLWMQFLLLIVLALTWVQTRWNRWQVWLVGMPLILMALWGATNTVARLLPNLV